MPRWSHGSHFLSWMLALFLSEQASAATYNFYFPKKDGSPKVEQVGEGEDEPVVVAEDEAEDALVEETVVVPKSRKRRRVVTLPPVAPQCASGTVVIPPIVLHANVATASPIVLDDEDVEEITEYVSPDEDLLTGTNTTPGHRLRPRTRVVRRTLVLDR